ncbi:hypothetical protein EBN03_29865 [Nocardia stercoris]|uniref:PA14 domain-containing protein n=2 Tax=Nocardia stercoris TaxID=2483361 RepID=A0A3M2KUU9_9NOCA|nr:hypothetical protein EBN03_29865 [Nocardia stercoris]
MMVIVAMGVTLLQVMSSSTASASPGKPDNHLPTPAKTHAVPLMSSQGPDAKKALQPMPVAPNFSKGDFKPLQRSTAGTHSGGFDPKSSKEASRNESAVEYVNTDGSHSLVLSQHPVSVSDGHGKWVPMDTRIAEDPSSHKARTANEATHAQFAEFANDPALVQVQPNGAPITLALNGAGKAGHKVADSTVTYADALPGQDLKYEVLPGAVKESVIVKSVKSIGDGQWTFTMKLGAGLTPKLDGDQVVVLDAKGQTIAVLPAIQVWDSAGNAKGKTTARTGGKYTLSQAKDGWQLTVSVDKGWLSDKARVFPVTVDPTVSVSNGFNGGTSRTAYTSTGQTYSYPGLDIGNLPAGGQDVFWRTAFGFDLSNLFGKQVIGARMDFQPWDSTVTYPPETVNLYQSTRPLGYNAEGALLASGQIGTAGSLYSQALTNLLSARVVNSDNTPQQFMLAGTETPGATTKMALNTNLIVDFGTPPPATVQSGSLPADQAVVATSTPTLSVPPVATPTPSGDTVLYCFQVSTGADGQSGYIAQSGCQTSNQWTMQDNVLQNGVEYTWTVQTAIQGGVTTTTPQWVNHFRYDRRLGANTLAPVDKFGPMTVNLYNANLSTEVDGPTFHSVGGDSGIKLFYNSVTSNSAMNGSAITNSANGVTATYFNDPTHTGTPGPTPVLVRNEPTIVQPGPPAVNGLDATWYVCRYEFWFQAPVDGDYRFDAAYRDGAAIWVDSGSGYTRMMNDPNGTRTTTDLNTVDAFNSSRDTTLKAGQRVKVRAELYHRVANEAPTMQLSFRSATGTGTSRTLNITPQTVPNALMYPTDSSPVPAGWTLSAGNSKYTNATMMVGSIVLQDNSGGTHTWVQNGSGGYTPPAGEDGVLSFDSTAGLITEAEGALVSVFNAGTGALQTVSSALDSRNPAALQYNYSPASAGIVPRLTSITDPVSGRSHKLYYNTDNSNSCYGGATPAPNSVVPPLNMLCRITYWDGSETRLWYSPWRTLDRVENPGGAYTDFKWALACNWQYFTSVLSCYDSGTPPSDPIQKEVAISQVGPMVSMRTPLANDWLATQTGFNGTTDRTSITWEQCPDKNRQIGVCPQAITSPATDGKTASTQQSHSYNFPTSGNNSAQVSSAGTLIRTAAFDATGRATSSQDADNVTTQMQWSATSPSQPAETIDGAGRVSTTIVDWDNRPTDTYGPAPASCFNSNQRPTAACATTVPHTQIKYDEGMQGLMATLYGNPTLSGAPAVWQTGIGTADGSLAGSWATAPVANTNGWSGRFTGEILLPTMGTFTFGLNATGNARLWIDDAKILDTKTGPTGTYNNLTGPNSWHRIKVEYDTAPASSSALNLTWIPPNGASATVPGQNLKPGYGLKTSVVTSDTSGGPERAPSTTVATSYSDPANGIDPVYGMVVATTADPNGLNLVRKNLFEAPGHGFLRPIATAMPSGDVTNPATRSTTTYYGNAETRSNPCVSGSAAVNQAGMPKLVTAATNSDGHANTTESVYDAAGRVVASRVNSDAWTCTTYDARGRATQSVFPALNGQPARTVTFSYGVSGGANYSYGADGAGNYGATVTYTDLLGQVIQYTDANGDITTNTHDTMGRLTQARTVNGGTWNSQVNYTYDNANLLKSVVLDGTTVAQPHYDSSEQMTDVTYNNSTSMKINQRNNTGAVTNLEWTGQGFDYLSTATRSQNNRITDEGIYNGGTTPTLLASDSYTYDTAGRLVAATVPHHQLTYSYAPTGGCGPNTAAGADTNRTSLSDSQDGAAATTTSYCYDNTDRLVSSSNGGTPTYDSYGDTTKSGTDTLVYDGARRHLSTTTASGTTIAYTRDAAGRLLGRQVSGAPPAVPSSTRYGYTSDGGSPELVLDTTVSPSANLLQRVLPLPGGAVLTKTYSPTAAQNWSYPDLRGNLLFTADGTGHATTGVHLYDPYGQDINATTGAIGDIAMPQTETGGMDLGWQGNSTQPIEHSGGQQYVEMGARTYVPSLGRFLQTDPVAGGSANGYAYTYGDPINSSDPTGRETTFGVIGGFLSLIGLGGLGGVFSAMDGLYDLFSPNAALQGVNRQLGDIGEILGGVGAAVAGLGDVAGLVAGFGIYLAGVAGAGSMLAGMSAVMAGASAAAAVLPVVGAAMIAVGTGIGIYLTWNSLQSQYVDSGGNWSSLIEPGLGILEGGVSVVAGLTTVFQGMPGFLMAMMPAA